MGVCVRRGGPIDILQHDPLTPDNSNQHEWRRRKEEEEEEGEEVHCKRPRLAHEDEGETKVQKRLHFQVITGVFTFVNKAEDDFYLNTRIK